MIIFHNIPTKKKQNKKFSNSKIIIEQGLSVPMSFRLLNVKVFEYYHNFSQEDICLQKLNMLFLKEFESKKSSL